MVASKCYEAPPPVEMANDAAVNNALMQADAVRMIGIRKKAGEPLVNCAFTGRLAKFAVGHSACNFLNIILMFYIYYLDCTHLLK